MQQREDDKFLRFISYIDRESLEEEMDFCYNLIKEKLNISMPLGFTRKTVNILAASICLSRIYENLQGDIVMGIANVMVGNMGVFNFPDYMEQIVARSPISESAWNDACNYLAKNHKWLEDHTFTEFYRD